MLGITTNIYLLVLDRVYIGLPFWGGEFFNAYKLDFSKYISDDITGVNSLSFEFPHLGVPATLFDVIIHFPEMILLGVLVLVWICSPLNWVLLRSTRWVYNIAYLVLVSYVGAVCLLGFAAYCYDVEKGTLYVWYDALISDYYIVVVKLIFTCLGLVVLFFMAVSFNDSDGYLINRYWLFILTATVLSGFILLLSTNDFLSFYAVLEFVSLITYVLPIVAKRDSGGVTASVVYYSSGAIASAILLWGSVLVSTEGAAFSFEKLETQWYQGNFTVTQIMGLILILFAFAIKIASFPAFSWVYDVYGNSEYSVLLVYAIIAKFGILGFFMRWYIILWPCLFQHYVFPVACLSIVTIVVGVLGAFYSFTRNDVKAFIGYTGINQIGYILMGLCFVDNLEIINATIYYFVAYLLANLLFIGSLVYLSVNGLRVTQFSELSLAYLGRYGTSYRYPIMVLGFSVWAMAGLPPFGNFFAKISLWSAILELLNNFFNFKSTGFFLTFDSHFFVSLFSHQLSAPVVLLILLLCSVVTSIVSIYYYIGVIGHILSKVPTVLNSKDRRVLLQDREVSFGWLTIVLFIVFLLSFWGIFLDDPFLVPSWLVCVI